MLREALTEKALSSSRVSQQYMGIDIFFQVFVVVFCIGSLVFGDDDDDDDDDDIVVSLWFNMYVMCGGSLMAIYRASECFEETNYDQSLSETWLSRSLVNTTASWPWHAMTHGIKPFCEWQSLPGVHPLGSQRDMGTWDRMTWWRRWRTMVNISRDWWHPTHWFINCCNIVIYWFWWSNVIFQHNFSRKLQDGLYWRSHPNMSTFEVQKHSKHTRHRRGGQIFSTQH